MTATAEAKSATPWQPGLKHATRLLVGAQPSPSGALELYAGFAVRLEPEWKTYWRAPGTAGGIPPLFDLSGSENVASHTVQFPMPNRYVDETGSTLGYKDNVVFPILITPADPSRPVRLRIKALFGVCKTICIPAEAAHSLTVAPAKLFSIPPALARAVRAVPPRQNFGETGAPELGVVDASFQAGKPGTVTIEVEHAKGADLPDVFLAPPQGAMFEGLKTTPVSATRTRVSARLPGWIEASAIRGKPVEIALRHGDTTRSVIWTVPAK
ncbi:MAG: protein-disulfide reductase DsbD domain-containing protein [Pseudomonadota bacterium]